MYCPISHNLFVWDLATFRSHLAGKVWRSPSSLSIQILKGHSCTSENSINWGSLEITPTVPLNAELHLFLPLFEWQWVIFLPLGSRQYHFSSQQQDGWKSPFLEKKRLLFWMDPRQLQGIRRWKFTQVIIQKPILLII